MRVASLWRYPVKSMRGEEVSAADVTEHGLVGDRAYALLDTELGRVASAKRHDRWGRLFQFTARYAAEPRPGEPLPPLRVTFPDGSEHPDGELESALAKEFDQPLEFASTAPENPRLDELWPEAKGPNHYGPVTGEVGEEEVVEVPVSFLSPGDFFDFSAIHLLTTSSLRELARREPEHRFDVRRFRPNIVVDVPGAEGFVENDWYRKTVRIGDTLVLEVIIPTPRCVMTTLAQDDLPRDPDVLRAAATHNMIRAGGLNEQPCLGVYASVLEPGRVTVGDTVRVE